MNPADGFSLRALSDESSVTDPQNSFCRFILGLAVAHSSISFPHFSCLLSSAVTVLCYVEPCSRILRQPDTLA